MLFDGFYEDGLHQMMEWGSDVWFILGIIIFFIIALILLYILRKGANKLQSTEIPSQRPNQKDLNSNQNIDEIKFCFDCGTKLDTQNIVYCPGMWSKNSIKAVK